jgi:peptidoglycan-N-acetylglucosamine deacetylase
MLVLGLSGHVAAEDCRVRTIRGLWLVVLALIGTAAAHAAECPGNRDALGTSRTLVVDPAAHARIGGFQYRESLPLEDHEVVLTFDDGPLPRESTAILDILASECVKATYFLVGQMARRFPEIVRRIHDAGHTIGTHTYSHPSRFRRMPIELAADQINDGIAAVSAALDGSPPAPFFRFPGLSRSEESEDYLAARHIQVWGVDAAADDWMRIAPGQVVERALAHLEAYHRGILLLHDIHPRTVEALPVLLRELKRRGYRIVHVVPATPGSPQTPTLPSQWTAPHHQPEVPIPEMNDTPSVAAGPPDAEYPPDADRPRDKRRRSRMAFGIDPEVDSTNGRLFRHFYLPYRFHLHHFHRPRRFAMWSRFHMRHRFFRPYWY